MKYRSKKIRRIRKRNTRKGKKVRGGIPPTRSDTQTRSDTSTRTTIFDRITGYHGTIPEQNTENLRDKMGLNYPQPSRYDVISNLGILKCEDVIKSMNKAAMNNFDIETFNLMNVEFRDINLYKGEPNPFTTNENYWKYYNACRILQLAKKYGVDVAEENGKKIINEDLIKNILFATIGRTDDQMTTITDKQVKDAQQFLTNLYPLKEIKDRQFKEIRFASIIIPEGVETIGKNAFFHTYYNTAVVPPTIIELPNSVINIGRYAFHNAGLNDFIIPDSVTKIGNYAFAHNQLTSVEIRNSVTNIGDFAFANNQLTSVTIPNSVTNIGDDAFSNNQLTSVTIPNSVTNIGDAAFEYNQLTSVEIPNSVTNIGESAFAHNQLTSVTIPNSVTNIGNFAFSKNQLTSVEMQNSVTNIGESAFFNNQLTSVTIPNSVTSIENFAFSNNKLTSVVIPNSVKTIGRGTFLNNQLTSVEIPNSVTNIGNHAFDEGVEII